MTRLSTTYRHFILGVKKLPYPLTMYSKNWYGRLIPLRLWKYFHQRFGCAAHQNADTNPDKVSVFSKWESHKTSLNDATTGETSSIWMRRVCNANKANDLELNTVLDRTIRCCSAILLPNFWEIFEKINPKSWNFPQNVENTRQNPRKLVQNPCKARETACKRRRRAFGV